MKEKLGIRDQTASAAGGTTHAFSMGQSMDTHVVDSSGEIGKLKAEIGVCQSHALHMCNAGSGERHSQESKNTFSG